jgi:hypothetical protein
VVEAGGLVQLLKGQGKRDVEPPGLGRRWPRTGGLFRPPGEGRKRHGLLRLERKAFGEVIMTHPHVLAVVGEISARWREQALAVEEKLPLL